MLGPAGYLLAILGCGEADAPCQQVQLAPARYETQAACLAASDEAAARADVPYPVVVAECRRAGTATAAVRADQVQRPGPATAPRLRTASASR